jgi:single-strand DNA-binding protein
MDLNRATIIGNVTRDPEVRTTPSGQSVASFGVATNMVWTDAQGQKQQRAEFHNIVAWGKLADICKQYLTKGKKIYLEGRLQTREWETPDAQKRTRTEIVAENMIMLDRGGATSAGGSSYQPTSLPPASSSPTSVPTIDRGVGDQEIRIEDIPF